MKNLIVTAVLAFSSFATAAQSIVGTAIGSAIGTLACSNVGGGSARYQAAAVCATVGGAIGGQWDQSRSSYSPQPSTYYYQQQPSQSYYTQQPVPQMGANDFTQQCAGERYIDGVYNPSAAQAYCRGRLARQAQEQARYEQDAYNRGLQGR